MVAEDAGIIRAQVKLIRQAGAALGHATAAATCAMFALA
jgi:hypothetical protein